MTNIEWTDETWNPVTGCTKVSAGCKNCYAEKVADRFWGDRKFTDVRTHNDRLDAPLHWRKSRRVFVNSMSDLFHDAVPDEFIDRVFGVMAAARTHTFQILTKRPDRMRRWFDRVGQFDAPDTFVQRAAYQGGCASAITYGAGGHLHKVKGTFLSFPWPLPNVWLGVSCEDQRAADERIPLLLQTPAAVRFVSCEPLLGPIDIPNGWLGEFDGQGGIDWVIAGGESGPGARPCDVEWIRSIVEQCQAARVACFVKQLGGYAILDPRYDRSVPGWTRKLRDPKGGDPEEWPEALRVREFPEAR